MLPKDAVLQQNRYRITHILGQGGMGAVYVAWHTGLEISVAIKELIPQPGLSPEALAELRKQFKREANTLARLSHHHLVHVIDSFEEGGNVYLVMELVQGESMAARIQRQGPIPEPYVLQWAQQLLDALAYCHGQGVIHRDIKPHNIILHADGRAVLVDFGLVKLWDPTDPRTKTVMRGMGTPEYAPPEQYDADAGHTDARSDIYSLGATLYHALSGKTPPTATTRIVNPQALTPVRVFDPRISPQVEQALMRALELRPIDRFQSAREMAAVLRTAEPWTTASRQPSAAAAPARPTPVTAAPPPPSAPPVATEVLSMAASPSGMPPAYNGAVVVTSPPPVAPPVKRQSAWISTTAFVLGVLAAISTFLLPLCAPFLCLAGIIFGLLGVRSKQRRGFAAIGLILCLFVLVFDVIVFLNVIKEYRGLNP